MESLWIKTEKEILENKEKIEGEEKWMEERKEVVKEGKEYYRKPLK